MKSRIITSATIIASTFFFIFSVAFAYPITPSAGVGANPQPGYYLQTNGVTSTWAAVSGGGGSSTTIYQGFGILVSASGTGYVVGVNSSTILTVASGTALYYPLSSNPAGYITSSTGLSYFAPSTTISFTGVVADAPLSGSGTSASHLIFTNPGYLTSSTGLTYFFPATTTIFLSTTTGNWQGTWQGVNSTTFYLASNPSGYLTSSTGLSYFAPSTTISSQWTTTSTGIYYNGGSVGIGTNSPQRLLHVFGDQSMGVALLERSNNGTSSAAYGTAILKYDTTANATSGQGLGYDFQLQDASGTNTQAGAYDVVSEGGGVSSTRTEIWTSNNKTNIKAATFDHLGQATFNTTTVSDFTNSAVKSALPVADSSGHQTSYAGSSCTNQGVTGISATGTMSCATFATSTNPGTVTTSSAGTANTIPIWTSGSALGNSHESESGTSTFINASSTYLGTNTSTATSSLVWISNYNGAGYWDATGTIPTLSSCGSSPTSTGNMDMGRVTTGSGATSCTLTWPIAFVKTPACIVTEETGSVTNALSYTPSTSTLVVTQTGLGGDIFDYKCEGQNE